MDEKKIEKKNEIIPLEFQGEIEKFLPTAGTIVLSPAQEIILYEPIKDDDVEIRPDGLVYLPWMEYASRLRRAFGLSWVLIPQGLPKIQGEIIYWGFHLIIRGNFSGFAIGEQKYQASNATMSYGDACEGAKSNALMRLCKGLGIGLELWKPSFVRAWREKFAEQFPGIQPDGRPIKDKNGKQKMLWRKKGETVEEQTEEMINSSSSSLVSVSAPTTDKIEQQKQQANTIITKKLAAICGGDVEQMNSVLESMTEGLSAMPTLDNLLSFSVSELKIIFDKVLILFKEYEEGQKKG